MSRFITGDIIKFRERAWMVMDNQSGKYSLESLDEDYMILSLRQHKIDNFSEVITLAERPKKVVKETKVLQQTVRKEKKWWKFW